MLKITPVIFIHWSQGVLSVTCHWHLTLVLWLWERLHECGMCISLGSYHVTMCNLPDL